jgi:GTPase involved in cell partitioning and DNA repair
VPTVGKQTNQYATQKYPKIFTHLTSYEPNFSDRPIFVIKNHITTNTAESEHLKSQNTYLTYRIIDIMGESEIKRFEAGLKAKQGGLG